MEKQYVCILNYKGNQLTVNVYAINRKRLKNKAIDAALEFLFELGHDHINIDDIDPVGFIDRGIWGRLMRSFLLSKIKGLYTYRVE